MAACVVYALRRSFWFSLSFSAGERCVPVHGICQTINIAFYGVESAHKLWLTRMHCFATKRCWEVESMRSIHMGQLVYFYVRHIRYLWKLRAHSDFSLKYKPSFNWLKINADKNRFIQQTRRGKISKIKSTNYANAMAFAAHWRLCLPQSARIIYPFSNVKKY